MNYVKHFDWGFGAVVFLAIVMCVWAVAMTRLRRERNRKMVEEVRRAHQVAGENHTVKWAYHTLTEAMRSDPSFASSWQCNIAIPIFDLAKGKLTLPEANAIADHLMKHLFEVPPSDERGSQSHS